MAGTIGSWWVQLTHDRPAVAQTSAGETASVLTCPTQKADRLWIDLIVAWKASRIVLKSERSY